MFIIYLTSVKNVKLVNICVVGITMSFHDTHFKIIM